jgi:hypothetical protein
MSDSSFSALLSKANKYTWHFRIGFNPNSISVLAFSLEEARREVLTKLRMISYLSPEYTRLEKELYTHKYDSPEHIALYKKRDALYDQLNIDRNLGCFCEGLFDYTPTLLVDCHTGEVTLEKLVSETDPKVSKINTMTVYSCLDG